MGSGFDMPTVNVDAIVDHMARIYADKIVRKGQLRASKPKLDRTDVESGRAAYIWRMVAFYASPRVRHQCMPVTSSFDLCPLDWSERKVVLPHLDRIVETILDAIPKEEWHGVRRWGQAFGRIGTPEHNTEGAVVYR